MAKTQKRVKRPRYFLRGGNDVGRFREAIQQDNLAVVERMVDGFDVNLTWLDGDMNVMSFAILFNKPHILSFLISKGAIQTGQTLVLAAGSMRGDACLEILLEHSPNLEYKNTNGETALFHATKTGSVRAVKMLLAKGANPNYVTLNGVTPLLSAILYDSFDKVKALVEGGADVRLPGGNNTTPLHFAAKTNLTILKYLWENGASADLNSATTAGATPLTMALKIPLCWPQARFLLENGAQCTVKTESGTTPIFLLLYGFLTDTRYNTDTYVSELRILCKTLAQCGADMNQEALEPNIQYPCTPLMLVVYMHKDETWLAQLLLELGADINKKLPSGYTAIIVALEGANTKGAEFLLDHGAISHESQKGMEGRTALHYAALLGHKRIAEKLIKGGHKVDAINDAGTTPFMQAAATGNLHILKFLLEQGANPNHVNVNRNTAILMAVKNKKWLLVDFLLDQNVSLMAQNMDGETVLTYVLANKNVDLAKKALFYSLKTTNSANKQLLASPLFMSTKLQKTPLMLALQIPDVELASLILSNLHVQAGHDSVSKHLNLQDTYGNTALFYAARNGTKALVEQMLKMGANPTIQNYGGDYAFQFANRDTKSLLMIAYPETNVSENARRAFYERRPGAPVQRLPEEPVQDNLPMPASGEGSNNNPLAPVHELLMNRVTENENLNPSELNQSNHFRRNTRRRKRQKKNRKN